MLQLTGSYGVGTVAEVIVVRPNAMLQAQQLFNGRTGYVDSTLHAARPGDRCRVMIVGEPPCKKFFILKVTEVLARGNGKSSDLEKLLARIERQGPPNFEEAMLANMRVEYLRELRPMAAMLETLFDLLEYHSLRRDQQAFGAPSHPLNYGHYCIVISRLISKLYAGDRAAYQRAAEYCRGRNEQWHEALRLAAR